MAFVQTERLLRMTGPFGDDEIHLTGFSAQETISRLFSAEIEFVSTRLDLKPADVIGQKVCVEVDRRTDDGDAIDPRFFDGYFNRFSAGPVSVFQDEEFRSYRAQIVPWLWFLTQTARCYIFFPEKEDKTIFEVIEDVFNRAKSDLHIQVDVDLAGISDLKQRKVKHCVQYRETDFNFVSRIMEQYGVHYHFLHEDSKHTMMLSTRKNYPKAIEADVRYIPYQHAANLEDHIDAWEHGYEFVSGEWEHTDYNFETPATSLNVDSPKIAPLIAPDSPSYEVYDFPGEYGVKGDGETDARVRQEEEEITHNTIRASSNCRTFAPGFQFVLTEYDDDSVKGDELGSYLITSVQHHASQAGPEASGGGNEEYRNSLTCIPATMQFRPARTTPKPMVPGLQSAVIVGPTGEEIYTDKYGRVKVCFHWDREGLKKKDSEGENCSCWVRVSQVHAGPSFGAINIPRMGEEVLISYLEGDVDQPIIVGRVYHAQNMPPFGLPASKTISGMKSQTYKGTGYNEMVFDDTPGNELIRVHGQFDKDATIQNDLREHVLNDRSRDVTNNEKIEIGVDRTETVGSNQDTTIGVNFTEAVGADRTRTVGSNETITVSLMRTHTVGINEMINVGAAQEVTVGGLRALTVGMSQTTTVGAGMTVTVGGNLKESIAKGQTVSVGKDQSVSVAKNITQSAGENQTETIGKKLMIDAGDEIMIKTGKASLLMKKDGTIQLSGKDITINGTGAINGKASKNIVLKGKKIMAN